MRAAQRQKTHPALSRCVFAATRLEHFVQPAPFGGGFLVHIALTAEAPRVQAFGALDAVQHHEIAASQQADKQREIQQRNETLRQRNGRQVFLDIGATHQRATETAQIIARRALENRQHVLALEHGVVGHEADVFHAGRQDIIIDIHQMALADDELDVLVGIKGLRLMRNAVVIEAVVITEKLDVLAARLLQPLEQVALKPQALRIAQVTGPVAVGSHQFVENRLDLVATAIVTDDDFEIVVDLVERTLQRCAEKTRIEGGNDDTDEGD